MTKTQQPQTDSILDSWKSQKHEQAAAVVEQMRKEREQEERDAR